MIESDNKVNKKWNQIEKISFLFIFIYLVLRIFPFPFNLIPKSNLLLGFYYSITDTIVNFFGNSFLNIEGEIPKRVTGSGDTIYKWVWHFSFIMLALIIGAIFSVIYRKKDNYEKLKSFLTLYVVYFLVFYLLAYGMIKIFCRQFPSPDLERLHQTYGQSSPMRLVWTFIGQSSMYSIFSGLTEYIAGVLIIFKRTRTLGALLAFGVMLNVFMLNMSYDIPVKLSSLDFMIASLYLINLNRNRLLNLFFLNKGFTASKDSIGLVSTEKGKLILKGINILLFGYFFYFTLNRVVSRPRRAKSSLYGVYNVKSFIKNKDTLAPLTTDSLRWKKILFDYSDYTSVILMNDKMKKYDTQLDTVSKKIIFSPVKDTITKYEFKYLFKGRNIHLKGVIEKDTFDIRTQNYDIKNFLLLNRGFNWVNESPYNKYNYDW